MDLRLNAIEQALTNGTKEQQLIADIGLTVISTLLRKNADYGGSVFKPPILNPRLPARSAIEVRLSDKIARYQNLRGREKEAQVDEPLKDTVLDLVGYFTLLLAEMELNG